MSTVDAVEAHSCVDNSEIHSEFRYELCYCRTDYLWMIEHANASLLPSVESRMSSKHESAKIIMFVFFLCFQPYALTSARMEARVQLQKTAPALVGGLGDLAVKVCDSVHVCDGDHQ